MMTLQIDGKHAREVATNGGWGDLCRFVDSIPLEDVPESTHLCEHGWSDEPETVADELESRMDDASEDVGHVMRNVVDAIRESPGCEVVSVTDGLGDESGDDDAPDAEIP